MPDDLFRNAKTKARVAASAAAFRESLTTPLDNPERDHRVAEYIAAANDRILRQEYDRIGAEPVVVDGMILSPELIESNRAFARKHHIGDEDEHKSHAYPVNTHTH